MNPAEEPHAQRGTVSPKGESAGVLYYPLPFASPPRLTLTGDKRDYTVTQQDEAGFTWAARDRAEDSLNLAADAAKDPSAAATLEKKRKPDVQYEDFTWEAKGLRSPGDRTPIRPSQQTGTFASRGGASGQVSFRMPDSWPGEGCPILGGTGVPPVLAGQDRRDAGPTGKPDSDRRCRNKVSPSNVVLSGPSHDDIIEECTPRRFRWRRHADPSDRLSQGEMTWTARGVKATAEDPGREDRDAAEVFEQSGEFAPTYKGSCEIYFPLPFQSPPNVELTYITSSGETKLDLDTIISGCTATGFQWKNVGSNDSYTVHWTAKGVKASPPVDKKDAPPTPKPG